MKILVLIKEIFDPATVISLKNDKEIDDTGMRYIINPYDQFALEEAICLKEKFGGEVVVISLGREEAESTVRNALASGADRARLIIANFKDPRAVSKILAENIQLEEEYDLILSGWIAVGDQNAQIPGRIGKILGLPTVTMVTKLDIEGKTASCEREGDGLLERLEVPLPAIIAVEKGINEPRLPTVINILRSNKLPLQKVVAQTVSSEMQKHVTYELRTRKRRGVIIKNVSPDESALFLLDAIFKEKLI